MPAHTEGNPQSTSYASELRKTILAAQQSGWQSAIAQIGEQFARCGEATFTGIEVARIMFDTLTRAQNRPVRLPTGPQENP